MTYVMSDLHGMCEKYVTMLDKIGGIKDGDRVYILGDIIDRGPDGDVILLSMMNDHFLFPFYALQKMQLHRFACICIAKNAAALFVCIRIDDFSYRLLAAFRRTLISSYLLRPPFCLRLIVVLIHFSFGI